MAAERPSISVIVPVYNGRNFLRRCLGAISASTFVPLEVIVADDGSTDDSAEICREMGATVVAAAIRSGPAAARNLAATTAVGDVLMFVDADVVVEAGTLAKVAAVFGDHADVSALFGSYDDEPAEPNFLSQYKNLQHHYVHQTSGSEAWTFWSGLGAIRREVFREIGGFDCEKFEVPSIEDIELGARLRNAGYRIVLDRKIQAKHLKRWDTVSLIKTDIFCRAVPWSRLLITGKGLVNDMNLKFSDRVSAILVAVSLAVLPLVFWKAALAGSILLFLLMFLYLNRGILGFFAEKRGVWFAARAVPWQILYFFYSGVVFVYSWLRYALPPILGIGRLKEVNGTRPIN